MIGVALLGFDSIATKIESPYGCGFNDIPLDAIVQRSKDIILDCLNAQSREKKAEDSGVDTESSFKNQNSDVEKTNVLKQNP